MEISGVQISAALESQLQSMGAAAIWLFGSRARGDYRADSDADVALLMRADVPPPGLRAQGSLAEALAESLLAPSVDLVVLDRVDLPLRGRVLSEGQLLWSGDEERRVRYTVDTLPRYWDVLPAVEEQDRSYLATIAEQGLE